MKILCWDEAERSNGLLPCGDTIYSKRGYVVHEVCRDGDGYSERDVDTIQGMTSFIKAQQALRNHTRNVPHDWNAYCVAGRSESARMGPRWTMPFCYFGNEHKECFRSVIGLDVGCNVLANSLRVYSDRFISRIKSIGEYRYEYEVCVSHYLHYQALGCQMHGIDLYPITTNHNVSQGDLRMLKYQDSTFDFITLSMVIGPSNPASFLIDAALCISELFRVSRSDSLVYIADFVVTPAFVIMATAFDFRVFTNNLYRNGIPIGVFLVKKSASSRSMFMRIVEALEPDELVIDTTRPQFIENRELLRLGSLPTCVTGSPTKQMQPTRDLAAVLRLM